ncbi:MAG TPA: DoxX family protein [Ktedonobacteraceae bacterium]|nr:DoxX family protein [Ktedonobacteraceae bacterium]
MNIALWIVQVVVGLMFLLIGIMKSSQSIEALGKRLSYARILPAPFVRFIGIAELLGGIGVILPPLVHILPWLAIVAAIGLGIIMVGGVIYHLQHKETTQAITPLVLLLLTLFIAIGRILYAPF